MEAEGRVRELRTSVTAQLRLIRKLEERGKDLTSAKIVFDSLRVSLFLATQDLHRAQCYREPGRIQKNANSTLPASEAEQSLVVVPIKEHHVWIGAEASMKAAGDFLDLTHKGGSKEVVQPRETSIAPDSAVEQEVGSSRGCFEFRPLTEEEKNEFENSLNADGKRILAQLGGKAARSSGSAA